MQNPSLASGHTMKKKQKVVDMNTEMKWVALVFIFVFGTPMAGMALNEYHKTQCRIEAIKAGMDPDKITQVCKS